MPHIASETDLRTYEAPKIAPDWSFPLDPKYCGRWLVAGDLTGNGMLELVSARNENQEITAFAVYTQKGEQLWTWGTPNIGSPKVSYDLPLQIYDINDDGLLEIIFCAKSHLIILEGKSGNEICRHPLPPGLAVVDCICFANLSGKARATDIIIKNRYRQIWAYTNQWKLLWTWAPRGGHKTCHHPTPVLFYGYGKDAIYAGHQMLDHRGKKLWTFNPSVFRVRGHLDAVRIVEQAKTLDQTRMILTYCGAKTIAMLNGKGKKLWSHSGQHFESITVGNFHPDYPAPQFYVDIDHLPYGEGLGFLFDYGGHQFATIHLNYGRHHRALDWNGDGLDEIVIANELALVNGKGEQIGTFQYKSFGGDVPETKENHEILNVSILDLTGNGKGDIVLHSANSVNIYYHPKNTAKPPHRIDLVNFTYY